MDLGIKGKFALVTGGTHGIGKSIAIALAKEGCNVAVCSRNKLRVSNTVTEITNIGVESIGIKADAVVEVDRIMKTIIQKWNTLHILINNVGGGGRWEFNSSVWMRVYEKNALTAARFTMGSIPFMKEQKWGRIITISSIYGKEAGGQPWFNMAKSAEISLMKTLAIDPTLAESNITFNSVAPGSIMIPDTGWDQVCKDDPMAFQKKINTLPLGRLGTPEEVAAVVVFLCSNQASLVNGACVTVDGAESRSF